MLQPFQYYKPVEVDEAIDMLTDFGERAKIIAGGTDLIVQLKEKFLSPEILIDISGILELKKLERQDQDVFVGAAVTMTQIGNWLDLREFRALAEGAFSVGSYQVRNIATIGGNLCNAVPSADTAPPLIALKARFHLKGPGKKKRIVEAEHFFRGPRKTILEADEILTGISLSSSNPYQVSRYIKYGPRNGMDLALTGVAVAAVFNNLEQVEHVRVALGAVAPVPLRVKAIEEFLVGKHLTEDVVRECASLAEKASCPISDMRASSAYRKELVGVMTKRALLDCKSQWKRRCAE